VQRAPEIFPALKRSVDDRKKPGLYLITGSALWLSMKAVSESLAGRVGLLELWPFRSAEWSERPALDFHWLLTTSLEEVAARKRPPLAREWLPEAVFRGGFPFPAGMETVGERRTWFHSYVKTYLERDVRDLARIENLGAYHRVLMTLLHRTGQLLNISALARDVGVPQPTASRYVEWLKTTYQCFLVEPYFLNLEKRLVKTPKLYWTDTAMVAALLDLQDWRQAETHDLAGRLVETWVAGEIKKHLASRGGGSFHFFRIHNGPEVDFLLDLPGGKVGGLEVKLGTKIDSRDLAGFEILRQKLKGRFQRGIVLHSGKEVAGLGRDLWAAPLDLLA
jgi:predicted AAA+ superfamily ATPase